MDRGRTAGAAGGRRLVHSPHLRPQQIQSRDRRSRQPGHRPPALHQRRHPPYHHSLARRRTRRHGTQQRARIRQRAFRQHHPRGRKSETAALAPQRGAGRGGDPRRLAIEAAPEPGVSSAAPVLAGFTLGGINLRDATFVFDDRAKPAHYELRKLNLHTGAVNLRDPVKLDLDFDFESAAPAVGGHLQLTTTAQYDAAGQTVSLNDLALAGELQGAAVPGGAATVKSTSAALLDLAGQQYKLRGLKLDLALRGD